MRKIFLVGLPVLLPMGSAAQLISGLLVCFISAMVYASYAPYVNPRDDRLSKVCQIVLFFSLGARIVPTPRRLAPPED